MVFFRAFCPLLDRDSLREIGKWVEREKEDDVHQRATGWSQTQAALVRAEPLYVDRDTRALSPSYCNFIASQPPHQGSSSFSRSTILSSHLLLLKGWIQSAWFDALLDLGVHFLTYVHVCRSTGLNLHQMTNYSLWTGPEIKSRFDFKFHAFFFLFLFVGRNSSNCDVYTTKTGSSSVRTPSKISDFSLIFASPVWNTGGSHLFCFFK